MHDPLLWQILAGVVSAPTLAILIRWARSLTDAGARARAKAADASTKIEAARAQQLADLHAEMRAHRVTRDAEILSMAVECARLREDAQADREAAQAFELQSVRDRGTIQRLGEEAERLRRELIECRKFSRLD